jgi:hypothetical protein
MVSQVEPHLDGGCRPGEEPNFEGVFTNICCEVGEIICKNSTSTLDPHPRLHIAREHGSTNRSGVVAPISLCARVRGPVKRLGSGPRVYTSLTVRSDHIRRSLRHLLPVRTHCINCWLLVNIIDDPPLSRGSTCNLITGNQGTKKLR